MLFLGPEPPAQLTANSSVRRAAARALLPGGISERVEPGGGVGSHHGISATVEMERLLPADDSKSTE